MMVAPFQVASQGLADWVVSLIVLVFFTSVALVVHFGFLRFVRFVIKVEATHPAIKVASIFRQILVIGLLLTGVYFALGNLKWWQAQPRLGILLDRVFAFSWTVLIILTVVRIVDAISEWYLNRLTMTAPERSQELQHHFNLARKVVTIVLGVLGLLYLLRALGVDISPLVASSAIGGLIIGLALQDTLSNLFAGFFINVDRPLKVGDFVRLESGEEGFVEEVGWRHTKVRLLTNNLVIIPNSKLSQSILVNYSLPTTELFVIVPCGVSYDSDLDFVEQVTLEVAKEVQRKVDGADPNWEPLVRWQNFGDFAITFTTVLKAKDVISQFRLRSAFIKNLHRRYKEVGIEIPFPIRTVILKPSQEAKLPQPDLTDSS